MRGDIAAGARPVRLAIGSTGLAAKALYQLGYLLTCVLLKEVRRVIEQNRFMRHEDLFEAFAFSITKGEVFRPPHD